MSGRRKLALALLAGAGLATLAWRADPAQLRTHFDDLKAAAEAHPAPAAAVFALCYTLATALSLPLASWLSLLAGALFGRAVGIPLVSLSATAGATLAMLGSRHLLADWVRRRYGPRLAGLDRRVREGGMWYLISLRLSLVVPFWLTNLGFGLTEMKAWRFALASWLGMIPATVLFVHAGHALAGVATPADVVTPGVLGAFLALAAVALLPALLRRRGPVLRNPERE